ncbi:MAG: CHASE domain-containing protein [Chromatiaceae bacterium]|nr:CHASE domain-containing protein [Chromatiaceae bacterium]
MLESFQKLSLRDQARVRVIGELGQIRARLESEINGNLLAIKGLTAVIAAQPDIDQAGFARIAQGLVGERRSLRNIAGAPDMVIRLMYPVEGNEAAIGLDYRTHVGQRDAALKAVETGGAVLAGPLTLVQGGTGLIVREPVFVAPDQAGQPRRVWGLVSAVLDVDRLYHAAGLDSAGRSGGLTLALRGTDGTGAKGNAFTVTRHCSRRTRSPPP